MSKTPPQRFHTLMQSFDLILGNHVLSMLKIDSSPHGRIAKIIKRICIFEKNWRSARTEAIADNMIGIFDSGEGGLSVFREIYRLLPEEKYVYYADNAHCPYGEKSAAFVLDRSRAITRFLLEKGCGIIVVACNTATGAAIQTLRKEFPVKFIGMEPAVKPAALSTRSGVIGVLATAGTLKAAKYLMTKGQYENGVRIVEQVGQGWVDLVERGILEGPEAEAVVERSVRPLLEAGADNLVLGCTHYPFLSKVIRTIAGPDVRIINPAPAAARHLVYVMVQEGLLDEKTATRALAKAAMPEDEKNIGPSEGKPDIELISSGDPAPLQHIFKMLYPGY